MLFSSRGPLIYDSPYFHSETLNLITVDRFSSKEGEAPEVKDLAEKVKALQLTESQLLQQIQDKEETITSLNNELSNANEWHRQLCLAQDQLQVGNCIIQS